MATRNATRDDKRILKHVWILNHYAQEPGGAGGTRHFSLARNVPDNGWKATIIAASTDHVSGVQRLNDDETVRLQSYAGVPFLWLRTRAYAGNGADRIGNMLGYTRAVLKPENLSGLEKPDVIIGSSVHPLAAWAGRRLARRYGVPFIFEVRDLWPQTLIDMGRLTRNHPISIALRVLEKSLYRSAARIIVLLPKAHEYIEGMGISRDKVVWIANGTDLGLFADWQPAAKSDIFTLMYFGAHGGANGLDNLLEAMALVEAGPHGANIRLRMIGDGPLKPALIEQARKLGLKNVSFEAPVAKKEIPALAAQADGFVACINDLPGLYRFGISLNKLFDYMAAGRPTIVSSSAVNNPIEDAGAGLTVAPENPQALADGICALAALPANERARMGQAGRHHLEQNYDMKVLAARLAATLDEVCRP